MRVKPLSGGLRTFWKAKESAITWFPAGALLAAPPRRFRFSQTYACKESKQIQWNMQTFLYMNARFKKHTKWTCVTYNERFGLSEAGLNFFWYILKSG